MTPILYYIGLYILFRIFRSILVYNISDNLSVFNCVKDYKLIYGTATGSWALGTL